MFGVLGLIYEIYISPTHIYTHTYLATYRERDNLIH